MRSFSSPFMPFVHRYQHAPAGSERRYRRTRDRTLDDARLYRAVILSATGSPRACRESGALGKSPPPRSTIARSNCSTFFSWDPGCLHNPGSFFS
jgi:hypothetical protein